VPTQLVLNEGRVSAPHQHCSLGWGAMDRTKEFRAFVASYRRANGLSKPQSELMPPVPRPTAFIVAATGIVGGGCGGRGGHLPGWAGAGPGGSFRVPAAGCLRRRVCCTFAVQPFGHAHRGAGRAGPPHATFAGTGAGSPAFLAVAQPPPGWCFVLARRRCGAPVRAAWNARSAYVLFGVGWRSLGRGWAGNTVCA
jgi:hypothetical protein